LKPGVVTSTMTMTITMTTARPDPAEPGASAAAALNRIVRSLSGEPAPWPRPGPVSAAGLHRARALFALLGNPQDAVPTVHVAGTAGKGSVVAFIEGLLHAHGFRVGAHSSPHVYSLGERFRIDGQPPDPELLRSALLTIRPALAALRAGPHGAPTYFETLNAMAFALFADRVDYSVVETGIGGRYDSTNTISRSDKLAVVTAIGLDHTDVLGTTLAQIAGHKAGIFPERGQAVVARPAQNEVATTVRAEQERRRCVVELVDVDGATADAVTTGAGTTLRLPDRSRWPLGLTGRHQAGNAYLALRAVAALAARDGWALDRAAVAEGLRGVRLPGRFERRMLPGGRPVVLDGAHNPLKLAALVDTLHQLHPGARFPWVVAFSADKDLAGALDVIGPAAGLVVATEFPAADGDHPAGVSIAPERVASAAAARSGVRVTIEADPTRAVARADAASRHPLPVVVAGSFHLLGAARAVSVPWP